MKYISEINAFYDWLETNSISDSAIALWHALMHISNKSGWITEFAVAISTLESKTGLKKDAIHRARQRLEQSGRIKFRKRSGQQSSVYTLIPFVSQNESYFETQTGRKPPHKPDVNQTQSDTIIRLDKTMNGDSNARAHEHYAKVYDIYQNNIGSISSVIEKDKLDELLQKYPVAWIEEAVRIAVMNSVKKISYICSILENWQNPSSAAQIKKNKAVPKKLSSLDYLNKKIEEGVN